MTAQELKRRAVLATRVDIEWRLKPSITPRTFQVIKSAGPGAIAKSKFVPGRGGLWLVNLLTDGTLCLQATDSIVPAVIDSSFRTDNRDVRMNLSLSDKNEPLVLLRTWSWDGV